MSRPGFRSDLLALRDGSLSFDDFARRHDTRFRKWAAHYFNRWPQTSLDLDDLAQEGIIEAWRAVDSWDPERTADVVRYVEYQVGRKIRVELERVLGWPNRSRGKAAVRPESIDAAVEVFNRTSKSTLVLSVLHGTNARLGVLRGTRRLNAEDRAIVADAAAAAPDAITSDVIAAVGLGMSAHTAARHIFEDDDRRICYGLTSFDDALRAVKRAIRREAKRLAA